MASDLITTLDMSNITQDSLTCTSSISSINSGVVQHGHVWSTSPDPVIETCLKTELGAKSEIGDFASNINGLEYATLYYVRAYVTNTEGVTIYGEEKFFTTLSRIEEYGFCWSTSPNPTIADNRTQLGDRDNPGVFDDILLNITAGTYYIRAYATNKFGTSYGNEIVLTVRDVYADKTNSTAITKDHIISVGCDIYPEKTPTDASSKDIGQYVIEGKPSTNVTYQSATLNADIVSIGTGITDYGHVWSTSPNPTIDMSIKTSFGVKLQPGSFSSEIENLDTAVLYYTRAYIIDSFGRVSYGNEVLLTTKSLALDHGFCWGTSINPTINDYITSLNGRTQHGAFEDIIHSITPNTDYYIRTYVTNKFGTSYGNQLNLKVCHIDAGKINANGAGKNHTISVGCDVSAEKSVAYGLEKIHGQYIVESKDVTNITFESATLNAYIESIGTGIEDHGFCWSTEPNPTVDLETKTSLGEKADIGSFYSDIDGLNTAILYYIRPYIVDNLGRISYGNEIFFTTDSLAVHHGFCWSISPSPTINDNKTDLNGRTQYGDFDDIIGGIEPNQNYYIRTYVTNKFGTSYGDEIILKVCHIDTDRAVASSWNKEHVISVGCDISSEKTITTAKEKISGQYIIESKDVTNITFESATLNSYINSLGCGVKDHGFCWSTNPNPTVDLQTKTSLGEKTVLGSFSSNIDGLETSILYYIRPYIVDSVGIVAYGNQIFFTTSSLAVSHGFCWSKNPNPTIEDFKTDLNGTTEHEAFIDILNNIEPDKYYIRSYVTNKFGTSYGNEIVLKVCHIDANKPVANAGPKDHIISVGCHITPNKTEATGATNSHGAITIYTSQEQDITDNNAAITGSVDFTGFSIIEHGHIWSKSKLELTVDSTSKTHLGAKSTPSQFVSNISGLDHSSLYYIRSYIMDADGKVVYGDINTFTTSLVALERGFCWSTSPNPTVDLLTKVSLGYGVKGEFTTKITGLLPLTQYYIRAYVTTTYGTTYGEEITFKTTKQIREAPSVPIIIDYGETYLTWQSDTGSIIVCNGEEKPSGSIWIGLETGVQYSAYAYIPEDEIHLRSPNSDIALGYTKFNQTAPSVPVVTAVGETYITWESDEGTIIVCNGEEKPSGSTWTGLETGVQHSAYAYCPEDTTHFRSPNSANGLVYTKYNQIAPTAPIVVDGDDISLVLKSDEGSIIVCNGEEKASGSTWTILETGVQYPVYAYYPEDKTYFRSDNSETVYVTPAILSPKLENIKLVKKVIKANINVEITSFRGEAASAHGFCLAEHPNPTVDDNKVDLGERSIVGVFSKTFDTLEYGKTYYIRAYAVNSAGTSYSEEVAVCLSGIAAEITKDGELQIAGNINTRIPTVMDGLVAHFPFDGIDKAIKPGNYEPIINSSTTLTYDGIAVEESTENLVITKGWTTEGTRDVEVPAYGPINPIITSYVTTEDLNELFKVNTNKVLSSGKSVSISGWFFVKNSQGGFNCIIDDSLNNNRNIGVYEHLSRGWHYLTWSYTNDNGSNMTINSISVETNYTGNNEAWGCNYQVEWNKEIATSFVNGSRTDTGRLELPLNVINHLEGSISFKMKFSQADNFTRLIGIGNPLDSITTDEFTIAFDDKDISAEGVKDIYFQISSKDSTDYITMNSNLKQLDINTWYDIAVTWSDSNMRIAMYIDGELVDEATPAESFIFPDYDMNSVIDVGDYSCINKSIVFKNLSFYDRPLASKEIRGLHGSRFDLWSNGDLIVNSINIRPHIPFDAYYFPLGNDAKDEYKIIDAVSSRNLIYEDGSVFVGNISSEDKGNLDFNLHESIGLDWSGDWSIIYWKKSMATHVNTLEGYNIESLGCNNNNIGSGYIWWGKTDNLNEFYGATNSSGSKVIDPNTYFGAWYMVSIVKSGSDITFKYHDICGDSYKRVEDGSIINTNNYFMTQYGYDLMLGGWGDTNICNTFYRDLIVVPNRALLDSELEEVSNTNMRLYKDNLQIQYQIREGINL